VLGIPPAVVTGRRQLTRFAYLGGLSYVMVSYDRGLGCVSDTALLPFEAFYGRLRPVCGDCGDCD